MKTRTFLLWALGLILVLPLGALMVMYVLAQGRETEPFGSLPTQGGDLVPSRDGSYFVLQRGPEQGQPLLFAHGTAAWSGLWLDTLEAMAARGYRAMAYDLPPFGYSEYPADGDYSRKRQATRIITLVEAMDVKPIAIGHSVGAAPLSEAVLRRPDLFAGFVIVDGAIGLNSHVASKSAPWPVSSDALRPWLTAGTVSNPLLTRQFLRGFMSQKAAATPEAVAILQQPMVRAGYTEAAAQWLPTLFEGPKDAVSTHVERWAEMALPFAIIWGETDTVTPVSQALALQAAVPSAELVILPDVGHIPQLEAPEAFRTALFAVLRRMQED